VHIPDGFVNGPMSVGGGMVAASGLALCSRRVARSMRERDLPVAGLCGAFLLMMEAPVIPVAPGAGGHLLGGTLAVALLGPWMGAVVVTMVTVILTLFAGDGGTTALGLNVVNLALVPAFLGYPVILAWRRVLPASPTGVAAACGLAALLSVVAAALLFTVEYALAGTVGVPPATMAAAVLGTYTVIGAFEGLVTALIVRALLRVRPDLVRVAVGPR
jgi:cobalt/nickel transport system permease protein